MTIPLRVLVVEDSEDDFLLLLREIKLGGYTPVYERVETAEAMIAALEIREWDIVIADYKLPHFNAPAALKILKETGLDLPFIVVSGNIGEETAVAIMRAGAHDYLMKGNYQRLVPAIRRELHEAGVRRERRRAEEDLLRAEQNFRNSLDTNPLGVRIITAEGELLYANQAILDIYGYSNPEELGAVPVSERYTSDSYADYREREEKRKSGEPVPPSYEISIVRKNNEVRHLAVYRNEVVWDNRKQYQLIYEDITDRKRAEEALIESERNYRQLANSISDVFLAMDKELKYTYWNSAAERITGIPAEAALGKCFQDLFQHDKAAKEARAVYQEVMRTRQPIHYISEYRWDGRDYILDVTVYPSGEGVSTFARNISRQKQLEKKLQHAAEEWKTTFDSISDMVSIHDRDCNIIRINRAVAEKLGVEPEEIIGRKCYEVFHGTNESISACPHVKSMKVKETISNEFFEPHLGIHLEVATSPILDEEGNAVASVHITRDVTERKSMQEQLMLADRLASIGQLAAGIAHELNNPLAGVIGVSRLLLDKDIPDVVRKDLEIIDGEASRAANVVRGLLTFARKKGDEKGLVDVNGIVQEVLQLRSYEQRVNNIEVNARYFKDMPYINGNGAQIQQVFMNLIVNAEQAMLDANGKGRLEVITEEEGNMVRISIRDDGPGITPVNMKKLFTPFFTTKDVGKGTGIGLSICHGIVTEHGGRIYAESEPGSGTTFIVELPASAGCSYSDFAN